ncbi:TPA: histidine kinase [Bacillus wiedmannii]|nr:histidine kinase [Bacillus wiedmannii]
MRINLLSILFLLFFTSCSPLNDNEVASVKPYKLTKEQSEILQMTPIGAGNRMFYNVALKNNNDELHATIEYYQNGKKVKEITNIASSHFLEKKIRLSFIAPYFHFDKDVQEKGQWYINIDGGSTLVPQDALLGINSSATTTIQTSKETVSVPTIDEDSGIDILLKENEHVYLFSIELKKEH